MRLQWRAWAAIAALVGLAATATPYAPFEVVGYGCAATTWCVAGALWQIEEDGPLVRTSAWTAPAALLSGAVALGAAWVFTFWLWEVVAVLLAGPCYTLMGVVWVRLTR